MVNNARVIGGVTRRCSQRATGLCKTFVTAECIPSNARTAEMCKLTENSFRDVNIAVTNELSVICDKFAINAWGLIRLANRCPRVDILQQGPGGGGHYIAVDPWFIVAKNAGEARLIRPARIVNDHKPMQVIDKIKKTAARFRQPRIACLGVSFKADIDDLRESLAPNIVKHLKEEAVGELFVVEPHFEEMLASLHADHVQLLSLNAAIHEPTSWCCSSTTKPSMTSHATS